MLPFHPVLLNVFPAGAGVILVELVNARLDGGFPRRCGGDPMLMDQFGISGEEAYNLIAQGAQNGLNKNGDLLDTINEYAVHFKQTGRGAEDFFNMLENGAEEGTFSVDKLGDAWKEFGIRAKDTTTTTTEAYEILGLNADEMRAKFAAGGESAKQATDTILTALFSMDDAVKQNQAGVDLSVLCGRTWERMQ